MALGVVLVMGVIVVALLRVAPKHDKEMNNAFEELAMRHGLRYQAEDKGQARDFAEGFDGIGALRSGSRDLANPRHVVSGVLDGQRILVFRWGLPDSEEAAAEWLVAGLEVKKPLADRCSVQFCRNQSDSETDYLVDPIVKERQIGPFQVVIRAADPSGAGRLLEDQVLEDLAARAGQVAFRPELQLRGRRVIAYPAGHRTTIDHVNELDRLLGLAQLAARRAG